MNSSNKNSLISKMVKKGLVFLLFLFPYRLIAQTESPNQDFKEIIGEIQNYTVPLVEVDSFKYMKSIYVLDAREKEEYDISHIKNAKNVGYIWFDMRDVYHIPKDATVVIYCTTGNRSEKIGKKLIKNGYKFVFNLYGGLFEWINTGNPIYKSNGIQTTEIHTFDPKWAEWVNRGTKIY
jgi:rhodanese-related sulfurtransferase